MADVDGLILQVLPVADSDAEELADLAAELHAELLSVDGTSVAPLPAEAAPERAKGFGDVAGHPRQAQPPPARPGCLGTTQRLHGSPLTPFARAP